VKTIEKIKQVFLVGDLKLEKERNKIIKETTTTTIKSKITRSKKCYKVLAKITDVSKIKVNQITMLSLNQINDNTGQGLYNIVMDAIFAEEKRKSYWK